MDGSLSSSRYGPADRGGGPERSSSYGGGDHGRRNYGRGRGRGHHHHGRRHHPYRQPPHHSSNRRGPRGPRNRFSSGGGRTQSVDPQTAMLRQLSAMVGRVGEGTNVTDIAKNIGDLANVLCNESNAPLFLKFAGHTPTEETKDQDTDMGNAGPAVSADGSAPADPDPVPADTSQASPQDNAGPLAHLVVSCVMSLPLSTPTYAGLTLAVHEQAPSPTYSGFANRCIEYALQHAARDMDGVLVRGEAPARPISRIKLVLRYLALLGRLRMVEGVADLLQSLTTAACRAASLGERTAACLLAYLVLSTLLYSQDYLPHDFVVNEILDPLEASFLGDSYKSTFVPGIGSTALLLANEQLDDDDDDEEEDDDEMNESAGQKCDTLQDLLRVVKRTVQARDVAVLPRFSLLTDAPWLNLKAPSIQTEQGATEEEAQALTYTGEPISISSLLGCKSIGILLAEDENDRNIRFQCCSLNGVVFGRLPIFGLPPDEDMEDEEEDDDDDMDDAPKNEQLQAYEKEFGLLDRFFLADAVRDSLLNHESTVSDTGVTCGSAKDVAVQVWSIVNVFPNRKGVEYGVMEAFISLIAQSDHHCTFKNISEGRVLLELTRLQPSIVPQALVAAVSNVVSYYMPSLVPAARENLSRWFAFHLTNTDYQWPPGYWGHWGEYVESDRRTSRSDFVKRVLAVMAAQLSSPAFLITSCLPQGSSLGGSIMESKSTASPEPTDNAVSAAERDLQSRIWEKNEDPDSVRSFLIGEELGETIAGSVGNGDKKSWWRASMLIRALLHPACREYEGLSSSILRARKPEAHVAEDNYGEDDVLTNLVDNIARYRSTLLAVLAADAEAVDDSIQQEDDLLVSGQGALLSEMKTCLRHSRVLFEACMTSLVDHQIVQTYGVLQWALNGAPVALWWELGCLSMRIELARLLDLGQNTEDMLIDGAAATSQSDVVDKRMQSVMEFLDPILLFATTKVCDQLRKIQHPRKRLTPSEVDWVEGTKLLLLSARYLVVSFMSVPGQKVRMSERDVLDHLCSMSKVLSGARLASTIHEAEGDSPALDAIGRILDAI